MADSPETQAWSDEYDRQQAQQAAQKTQEAQPKQPPSLLERFGGAVGRVTTSMLDSTMSAAESYFNSDAGHKARDVVAGGITGATNTADAAGSFLSSSGRGLSMAEDPDNADAAATGTMPTSPIWDHAKGAILDFRDAVAVQDPTLADNLVQGAAQLAIPFAGYSRALAWLHGFANVAAAGALTDATALPPNAPRMADLIALGKQTEGKLGETLRSLGPHGLDAYINFLASDPKDSEAEARFKNVLDGFGVNMIATPLLHAAGVVLKQGTAGLRYAVENGVGSADHLMPPNQEGKIVFHGTGTDFDEFDSSKIGTGEGNQTFGHGLYFAENADTAAHYQQMLSRRYMPTGSPLYNAHSAMTQAKGNSREAYQYLVKKASTVTDIDHRQSLLKSADLVKGGSLPSPGKLMHVDIDDEHINNMIDWDKPISEQPNLQKAFKDLDVQIVPGPNRDFQVTVNGKPGPRYLTRAAAMSETDLLRSDSSHGAVGAGTGYQQLSEALRSDKAASEYLGSKGIPGIKYWDQGSRDTGKGTRNIVLFDAKHAKIVKKE